jgi:hypothetical protein
MSDLLLSRSTFRSIMPVLPRRHVGAYNYDLGEASFIRGITAGNAKR